MRWAAAEPCGGHALGTCTAPQHTAAGPCLTTAAQGPAPSTFIGPGTHKERGSLVGHLETLPRDNILSDGSGALSCVKRAQQGMGRGALEGGGVPGRPACAQPLSP